MSKVTQSPPGGVVKDGRQVDLNNPLVDAVDNQDEVGRNPVGGQPVEDSVVPEVGEPIEAIEELEETILKQAPDTPKPSFESTESVLSSRVHFSTVLILDADPGIQASQPGPDIMRNVMGYNCWSSLAKVSTTSHGKTQPEGVMRAYLREYLTEINLLLKKEFIVLSEDVEAVQGLVSRFVSTATERALWNVYQKGLASLPETGDGTEEAEIGFAEFQEISGIYPRVMLISQPQEDDDYISEVTHAVVKIHFRNPVVFSDNQLKSEQQSPEGMLSAFLKIGNALLQRLQVDTASMDIGVAISNRNLRNQKVRECLEFCSRDDEFPNMFDRSHLRSLASVDLKTLDGQLFQRLQLKYPILTIEAGESMDNYLDAVFGSSSSDLLYLRKFSKVEGDE